MSPQVFAFISGKGGTGKTTLCISMGFMLAAAGYRVRMIDADLATHGLTYFFDGYEGVPIPDLAEKTHLDDIEPITIPLTGAPSVAGLLTLVPSPIEEKPWNEDRTSSWALRSLEDCIEQASREMDIVLVDCQAGMNRVLNSVLPSSKHTVVVTEADPVSVRAVEGLAGTVRPVQSGRLWGVVSRVFPEEQQYYEALTDYLTGIKFVGMVPFDRDVRRSFFNRENPINYEAPGPFAVSLKRVLTSIDPGLSERLDQQSTFEELRPHKVQKDIQELLRLREAVEKQYYAALFLIRRQKVAALAASALAATAAVIALVLQTLNVISSDLGLAVTAVGALLAYLGTRWKSIFPPDPLVERRIERTRDMLINIEERIDAYRISESSDTITEVALHAGSRPPQPS